VPNRCVPLSCLAYLLLTGALAAAPDPAEPPPPVKTYGSAVVGYYRESVVVKDALHLSRVTPTSGKPDWVAGSIARQLKVKKIDWAKQMVVVVYTGERSDELAPELKALQVKGGKLLVRWKPAAFPPGNTKWKHPALMLLVDRFNGEVVFDPPVPPK
jgi:hypothetical protein